MKKPNATQQGNRIYRLPSVWISQAEHEQLVAATQAGGRKRTFSSVIRERLFGKASFSLSPADEETISRLFLELNVIRRSLEKTHHPCQSNVEVMLELLSGLEESLMSSS